MHQTSGGPIIQRTRVSLVHLGTQPIPLYCLTNFSQNLFIWLRTKVIEHFTDRDRLKARDTHINKMLIETTRTRR